MNYMKYLVVIFFASLLTSCSMVSDPLKKIGFDERVVNYQGDDCLLYTSPSPRDQRGSRMPSSA